MPGVLGAPWGAGGSLGAWRSLRGSGGGAGGALRGPVEEVFTQGASEDVHDKIIYYAGIITSGTYEASMVCPWRRACSLEVLEGPCGGLGVLEGPWGGPGVLAVAVGLGLDLQALGS